MHPNVYFEIIFNIIINIQLIICIGLSSLDRVCVLSGEVNRSSIVSNSNIYYIYTYIDTLHLPRGGKRKGSSVCVYIQQTHFI